MGADTTPSSSTDDLLTYRAAQPTPMRHMPKRPPRLEIGTSPRAWGLLESPGLLADSSVSSGKKRKAVSPPRCPSSPNDVFMSTPWRKSIARGSKLTPLSHGVSSSTPQQTKARLAIQQHDRHHDAIIVTTLSEYPFHCHEELLSMSGSELRGVAAQFNARLPINALLPTSDSTSSVQLREEIEKLVGIVEEDDDGQSRLQISQPPDLADLLDERMSSPPSSPLSKHASRKRRFRVSAPAGLLESVAEEDEVTTARSSKRQRISKNMSDETAIATSSRHRATPDQEPDYTRERSCRRLLRQAE